MVLVSAFLTAFGLAAVASAHAISRRAPSVDDCPGYIASNWNQTETSFSADLTLGGTPCNVYGQDLKDLRLQVEYQTENRLHVLISDAANNVYQVPGTVFPRPDASDKCLVSESNLVFSMVSEPFSFAVSRKDSGETLFNTSGTQIVFESQYLRLRTSLPEKPHLYGLGEHTDSFMLETSGYQRTMWNRDAPNTPPRSNLYGHHDIYFDHRGDNGTHGVFFLNSNALDIKIDDDAGQYLEYNTVGGVLDFYFLAGPTPRDVSKQYAQVAKYPALQPYSAFGFHNCRYGYRDVYAVAEAIANYSAAGIPLETMWTDIDYMNERRVFSTDPERFPLEKLREIVDHLHTHQQKYVVMVDPAVYAGDEGNEGPYNRGVEQGAFLNANGSVYHPVVWPGVTAYPDWFAAGTQDYWNNEFQTFFDAETGVDIDYLWIDMNEPSNFCPFPCTDPDAYAISSGNPPAPPAVRDSPPRPIQGFPADFQPASSMMTKRQEKSIGGQAMGLPGRDLLFPAYQVNNTYGVLSNKTANTDVMHANGLVMYDTHDLFGSMMSTASRRAMISRRPTKRALVITRSTFAGAGKDVGHWLGDNASTWFHYRISIAEMLEFVAMFQVPMVGADVCGFNANTTEILCSRWATLGAFSPFYRNHNDIASIPQEFYRWPMTTAAARHAIDYRYRLLDYLYTAMWQQNQTGSPVLNPMFFNYPNDPKTFPIAEQFFFGDSVLVSPVIEENSTSVDFYLPDDIFYDFFTHEVVRGEGKTVHLDNVGYTEIPVHIKGGAILPLRTRSANTTTELRKQNFTVVVAPGLDHKASGLLYIDDGESLVQNGTTEADFSYDNGSFEMRGKFEYDTGVSVDAVTILGVKADPGQVASYSTMYNATSEELHVAVGQPLTKGLSFRLM